MTDPALAQAMVFQRPFMLRLSVWNNLRLALWLAGVPAAERADRAQQALQRAGLAELRNGLRAQVAASPLCDGKRFAMHFMALMRDVWQQWITQSAPDGTAQQPTRGNPASRP